jgi:HK97 family phage major capsid protein/HK97 family phage prohead protease
MRPRRCDPKAPGDQTEGAPMNRAYSILQVKAMDAERRQFSGTATTPTPDRMGDIIEPLGVEFKNPIKLLWQHKHDQPIGEVIFKKPTKNGIDFEAQIASIDTPGNLKNRLDEAWDSIRSGLVSAVSIGFRAKEYAFIKETDGIHFTKTEVYELSAVTIPANADATIGHIRSIDHPLLAASGISATDDSDRPKPPGVSGKVASAQQKEPPKAKERTMPKTIAEQISAFEATRAAKAARREELMMKSGEEGKTLDQTESEEYDTLDGEVKKIDEHLGRLADLEKSNMARAKAVEAQKSNIILPEQRTVFQGAVQVKANVPPGTSFIRYAQALAAGRGNRWESINYAKASEKFGGWSNTPEVLQLLESDVQTLMKDPYMMHVAKAAVGAGTTTDATWASPLVVYQVLADQFIELLRPATIIGRIPGLRRVPFNIQMSQATSGSSMGWVGEGAPKPVSQMAFATVTLRWAKAAGIVIITDELARFSNPAAEAIVRNDMVESMTQFLDRQFIDPAISAVANVSPASITNGVTPITPSGSNQAAFQADVKTLFATFLAANLSTAGGVWIGTQQQALAFSLMLNALGQPFYSQMSGEGGILAGYPYIASENIPATGGSPADGYPLIFAKASEIMLADDGQTVLDASNQASVQMDSAPDSPPSGTTTLMSLWQMNMTGIRAERWINWQKRRSTAVAFIQNAKYG